MIHEVRKKIQLTFPRKKYPIIVFLFQYHSLKTRAFLLPGKNYINNKLILYFLILYMDTGRFFMTCQIAS